jgi:chorismate synthase
VTCPTRPLCRRRNNDVRCPIPAAVEAMRAHIWEIMQAKDTIGGVFEVVALGVPPGLGSHVHWDRRLDGLLMGAVGSIHAIKGVEIGPAFAGSDRPAPRSTTRFSWPKTATIVVRRYTITAAALRGASPPANRSLCGRP